VGHNAVAKRKVHSTYGIEPLSSNPWPFTLMTEPSWLTHMNRSVVIDNTQIHIINMKRFNAFN
jgi:hypothetical protein